MFYKALGFAVWKLSTRYARRRYGHLAKPAAAALAVVALIAVYVVTRGDDE